MFARLILTVVIVAMLGLAPIAAGQEAPEPGDTIPVPQSCRADDGTSTIQSNTESSLTTGTPDGVTVTLLADQASESPPRFVRGLVLTVRSLTLDPGAVSEQRKAPGPVLFHVDAGVVGISINGNLQVYDEGASVLVDTSQNYVLRNEFAGSATLFRLALSPSDKETTIGNSDLAALAAGDKEVAATPEAAIESRLHLQGATLPIDGGTRLFLACMEMPDPAVDHGQVSHPGSLGLIVIRGQVLVGDSGRLGPGECALYQPDTPYRIKAGEPSTIVLLAGVRPEGAAWWGIPAERDEADRPAGRFSFQCGEPGENDAASIPRAG